MADATYVQSNFSGGEFSPAYQGRIDDNDYKHGLALCLNYIPTQELRLLGRSGFKRIGNTRGNGVARLLPFRFTPFQPYVSEFTSDNLRLWANGLPIMDRFAASFISATGNPPTFSVSDDSTATNVVPATWNTGDRLLCLIRSANAAENVGYLANREFILNIVSRPSGTLTLTDAVTGSPLSGAVSGISGGEIKFYRIHDMVTPYQYPEGVRQVQLTNQQVTSVNGTNGIRVSPPDHRATYFYPLVSPRSLSWAIGAIQGLQTEQFIDGPYLDSFGTDIPMTVSGTTGSITVTIHGYNSSTVYQKGDLVVNYSGGPFYFLSLTANNKGNALPTGSAPYVSANWVALNAVEELWDATDTYGLAQAVGYLPRNAQGVDTIYYSKITGNNNNEPDTSPTDWQTTIPAWSNSAAYPGAAWVTDAGITYVSVASTTAGQDPPSNPSLWVVAPNLATAFNTLENTVTGWLSAPIFYTDDAGGSLSGINLGNPSRLIRLKWGPQSWSDTFSYSIGNLVNFNDVIYQSLTNANVGNEPDTDTTNWEISSKTIQWTWGKITNASTHMLQATVQLLGADLPTADPVWEFRFGVYSDSTGWPTCGGYHEGRLYLGGVVPNRFDAGQPDQGFNFAPTAADGTVSDGNAISYTLNTEETEAIVGFNSIAEGMVIRTSEAEWLVAASALNDPITPTSVQAHRTTAWAALPNEASRLPSALAVVQKGGRRVLEYRTFIDMTSYQSRLNTNDLTLRCQHLTVGGVGMTQYQSLAQPILWCCANSNLIAEFDPLPHLACPVSVDSPTVDPSQSNANLFGIGYSRTPGLSYEAPFSFEHGLTLSTGFTQQIASIAIQRGVLDTDENLYATVTGSDGLNYVEMMMPLFDSSDLVTTYNGSGIVTYFGSISRAYMLDAGRTPCGAKIASNGLSATFYGLYELAGKTVSFTIMGKYVGDVTIASDGSVNVPFSTAFLISDVGQAMYSLDNTNTNLLPGSFQEFWLDLNGNSPSVVKNNGTDQTGFYGQFGYKFRRRGQMLKPQVGGLNGPTFAKTVRADKASIYVDACQQVNVGTDFSSLVPAPLTKTSDNKNQTPLGPADFVSGVFRIEIPGDYDFNGQICWEQTTPVPGAVLAVGGFDLVVDQ